MSALALKADIHRGYGNACHVPQAGFMRCSKKKALFDHPVGARRGSRLAFAALASISRTAALWASPSAPVPEFSSI